MWRYGGHWTERVSLFPISWRPGGKSPIGSPFLFGNFPKRLWYSVSIAEKVSNPLRAFPKESPIGSAQMFSKSFQAYFPTCLDIAFPLHFPRSSIFLFIKIRNRRHNRKILIPPAVLVLIMICPTTRLMAKLKLV